MNVMKVKRDVLMVLVLLIHVVPLLLVLNLLPIIAMITLVKKTPEIALKCQNAVH
jgi:hypothetical protein